MHKTPLLAAAAIAAALMAAGCGNESSASTGAKQDQSHAKAAARPRTPGTVAVSLSEFKIAPATDHVKAGKVTFHVKNTGSAPHEMVVIKTSEDAGALGSGTRIPENGSVGEASEMPGGASKTLTLNMKPGHYALICNVPSHYQSGMHADFTVG